MAGEHVDVGRFAERFGDAARRSGFELDTAQVSVVDRLAQLGAEIPRWRGPFGRQPRGVYLWGPVGRGKSWLMNVFYETVPTDRKHRVHFYDFFRQFHAAYSRHRRKPQAVDFAVEELLDNFRLLCFDEFHVHDAGDAMLISRLFTSLFEKKITLLVTSNYPPDGLLPNPIYHHLFVPMIEKIERTMDVVELAGPRDYRGRSWSGGPRSRFETGVYVWPGRDAQLRDVGLETPSEEETTVLDVGDRRIRALAARDDLVWFDFFDVCDTARSTTDYLILAGRFTTWVISGLPRFEEVGRDARQRFANVVDILCDKDARLFLVAAAPLDEVLSGDGLPIDIGRIASRLSLLSAVSPGEPDRSWKETG
ncbi:cell division protein ZapE [Protofrankia symbiont of Coriaria ruscifolia]|uniref:AFG1 family ATPase n=1 Tax=Candidatus Protofrankia californiensis TaxID=1839754 RepID=A0A1C3NW55_9ACTN|nr:cell division protein ZapE [Protofrankia symbiont of Coriaria ruscifolia]SBW20474.1 AFG1 family ATPase [Candidatus Protofrankia californiensis]